MRNVIRYCRACKIVIPDDATHLHKIKDEYQCKFYVLKEDYVELLEAAKLASMFIKTILEKEGLNDPPESVLKMKSKLEHAIAKAEGK